MSERGDGKNPLIGLLFPEVDFSPASGDGYAAGFSDGYDQGREQGDNDARVILQDLIAELVGMADQGLDSGWAPLIPVADRAEARLREVTGHE